MDICKYTKEKWIIDESKNEAQLELNLKVKIT
jgi:hypothetical protein